MELDCASRLLTPVQVDCQFSWWMSPLAPLPLSNWLLPPFRFSGPLRFVPTWPAIGATIGPDTATASAPPTAPTAPANAEALDCAP